MAKFNLTSQIVDQEMKVFMNWDGFDATSSDDVVSFIEGLAEDDESIDLHINCAGGIVQEGWRMYDALRQSGRKITAYVEGECSSMAVAVLLAAPKDARFAYANSRICIHNPEACYLDVDYNTRLTANNIDAMASSLMKQAEQLRAEQQHILDLYVERTGSDAEALQALMNEDKYITMAKAKELGFITDTLAPNTAKKTNPFRNKNQMNNSKAKVQVEENWLNRLLAKAGFKSKDEVKFSDLKLTAADGSELEVEREEGDPQAGDAASPDGTFTMEDGTVIVVADGVITSIENPASNEQNLFDPETGNELTEEEAQQKLIDLYSRVKELEEKLAASETETEDLKKQAEDLKKDIVSNEQKEILEIVNKAGGKKWLDMIKDLQSKGDPKTNPQTQFKNAKDDPNNHSQFLNDQKKPFRYRSRR